MAKSPTENASSSPISDDLKSLPMEYLIAAPLTASIKAQHQLGKEMINFVNMLAFGEGEGKTGASSKEIVKIAMDLERPVIDGDGNITTQVVSVAPPVLGLVPVPALLIDTVDINFSMEIHMVTGSKETSDQSASVTAKGGVNSLFYSASVEATGKMSTQRENTRSTDKSAKYDVTVHASQQPPTEGMAKLMDLLASTVEPIKIEKKK
ncbi:MAG: DUF2589 domain-containing protein [Hyphomicrobiales bacterium]